MIKIVSTDNNVINLIDPDITMDSIKEAILGKADWLFVNDDTDIVAILRTEHIITVTKHAD